MVSTVAVLGPWQGLFFPSEATEGEQFEQRTARVAGVTARVGTETWNEQALVERAKAGDRAALGKLLMHFGPRLHRSVLLPRLGSDARAHDALSATYERVIQRLDRYVWQPCGLYPWLRVIAMRIALDMIRSARHEVLFDTETLGQELDRAEAALGHGATMEAQVQEQHDLDVARLRVQRALDRINPRYAQAIRLRVLEDRSRDEVAAQMGVTLSTFDVLLHRSMAALRKALQADGPEGQES